MEKKKLGIKEILEYECHSHWLVKHISHPLGQEILAYLIARKVSRKYKRYAASLEMKNQILNLK